MAEMDITGVGKTLNEAIGDLFKRSSEKFAALQRELIEKDLRGDPNRFDGFHSLIEKDINVDDINIREKMMVPQINMPKRDMSRYNGGATDIDFGQITMPLPYPDEGKKWALEWHDTPSGELLPEIVQVELNADISAWREGYPKYDK